MPHGEADHRTGLPGRNKRESINMGSVGGGVQTEISQIRVVTAAAAVSMETSGYR